ncbi:MAG: hypothetical protein DRQ14_06440, partial [Candidatus Latescibacterota bacterium]
MIAGGEQRHFFFPRPGPHSQVHQLYQVLQCIRLIGENLRGQVGESTRLLQGLTQLMQPTVATKKEIEQAPDA